MRLHAPVSTLLLVLLAPLALAQEGGPDTAAAAPVVGGSCTEQTCPKVSARFQATKDEIAQLDDQAATPPFLSGYWSALQDVVAELGCAEA